MRLIIGGVSQAKVKVKILFYHANCSANERKRKKRIIFCLIKNYCVIRCWWRWLQKRVIFTYGAFGKIYSVFHLAKKIEMGSVFVTIMFYGYVAMNELLRETGR